MKMPIVIACLTGVMAGFLSGCATSGEGPTPNYQVGADLRPIPGSITYGGQPRTRLTKAPVGSLVQHEFRNDEGLLVHETYVIEPDRSLRIVQRRVFRSPFGLNDP